MAKKGMKVFDWVLSLLVLLAIISIGTIAWFDFNIIQWLSFSVGWLYKTLATIVGVLGLIGLIRLIWLTFKKL